MSTVTLTEGEVRTLRRYLATEADESLPDPERHGARLQLCAVLAAALDDERPDVDHAGRGADHVLALVVGLDPTYLVTPESHDRMVVLLQSVAHLLAIGGAR